MNFSLKIAKHNIKNSRKSLLSSSTYQIYEKKVKHIKFLNKSIIHVLQINPFIILYLYTDNTISMLNQLKKKNNIFVSNLKFSKTKRILENHFLLNKYISKKNILIKNMFYVTLQKNSPNVIKQSHNFANIYDFENYLLNLKKSYMFNFIKTRFSLFFFQNYLIKNSKKSNDFLTNFEINSKKSFIFDIFNFLNIIYFLNFHLIYFVKDKNFFFSVKKKHV